MAEGPPCIKLPTIANIPSVTLPLGGSLSAFADFSVATPTDSTLTFNLLAQLAPLLASMSVLLKVLGVIGALKEFATDPLGKGPDLITAIEQVAEYIAMVTNPAISIFACLKDTLQLIVNFIDSIVTQLESLVTFHASIDLDSAQGDPVLLASLQCAQENANISAQSLIQSIGPMQPLIGIVNTLMGIANLPEIQLSVDTSGGANQAEVVTTLKQTVDTLKNTLSSIPG